MGVDPNRLRALRTQEQPLGLVVRSGRSGFGFPLGLLDAQLLAAARLVGKHRPRRFGPAATLAHVVERRRFRLAPRLLGTGKEELQVRAASRVAAVIDRANLNRD
jgi:hypothetical protein